MPPLPPLTSSRSLHGWPVTLDCGPLRIRPLRKRDGRVWREVREANLEWLTPWEATNPVDGRSTFGDFNGMVRAGDRLARNGSALPFALEWRGEEARQLIGQVSVFQITWGSARSAQLGYWIDQRMAGRGLMPLAVAMTCDYLWGVARLHRIEIAIRPENHASLRIVEKLGFPEEGMRPGYLHIDGDWRDHRVFALNRGQVPAGLMCRCPTPRW